MGRLIVSPLLLVLICCASPLTAARSVFEEYPDLRREAGQVLPAGMDASAMERLLRNYCAMGDPEMALGMRMILSADRGRNSEPNQALGLLLHLLQTASVEAGDTMAVAIALAHAKLYASVNETIRGEIRRDVTRQYALSRRLAAWQDQRFEFRYNISRLPLVPKIYWADRMVYPPEDIRYPVRTLEDYRDYVESIETLEYFHALAERSALYKGATPGDVAKAVYRFVHAKDKNGTKRHLYDPSLEKVRELFRFYPHDASQGEVGADKRIRYRGISRTASGFIWINYQRTLLERTGHTIGLCEVSSLFELALFKGMGMASGLMIRFPPKDRPIPGHVFAMYYDPFFQRWNNLEMIKSLKRTFEMEAVIHKPVWHHRLRGLREKVSEKAAAPRFFAVLSHGISRPVFDRMFFSNTEVFEDTMFSEDTLPEKPQDSDGDGIADFEERRLGLDHKRADTARDGVSDLWKLYQGYDPKKSLAAGSLAAPPLDGLGGGYAWPSQTKTVTVRRHTGRKPAEAANEINTISAVRIGERIYLRVTYHNDIQKTKRRSHNLHIENTGGRGRIPGFDILVTPRAAAPANDKTRALSGDGFADLRGAALREVECMIPLRYCDGARSLRIRVFTALVRGELVLDL
ncbi:MAG TPA: hypothetical protein PK297_10140 [Spirochaetota bacterium]|nr:hypothetical protein [Spirochaetota bacterium]